VKLHGGNVLAYLRVVGIGMLTMLMIGLALQMLATLKEKAHNLYLPRRQALTYWGIALAVAVGLFVWLLLYRS